MSGRCANLCSKLPKPVRMVVLDECRTCHLRASEHDPARDQDAVESHAFQPVSPVYLCSSCRRELGYSS